VIQCGSRNRHLIDDDFNGFVTYARSHDGIRKFFECLPYSILYGEWLVKHTIQYRHTFYKKFYLFDVHNAGEFSSPETVAYIANKFGIDSVPNIAKLNNPTIDQINELVGVSRFGDKGEGVVIKNMDFVNKFGDLVFAKVVCPDFKEKNLLVFNDNDKHSESYNEMYFVNKYMTLQRVKKVTEKLRPQINEKLDMKHIPRVCETAYHDMLTEEIWEASKKIQCVDFKRLRNIASKKAKIIYLDILEEMRAISQ